MNEWLVEVQLDSGSVVDLELLGPDKCIVKVPPAWLSTPADSRFAITSAEWVGPLEPGAVREKARALIRDIGNMLERDSALHGTALIGRYVWQHDADVDGGFRRHVFIEAQGTAIGIGVVEGRVLINGFEQAPSRTTGQRQREYSATNADFARALALFEQAGTDIPKLYIAFEYVEKRSGHKPTEFAARKEIAAFKETADNRPHVRHIGGQRSNSYPEVFGSDARELIRRLLLGWLDADHPY